MSNATTAYSGELLKRRWKGQRIARINAAIKAAELEQRRPDRVLDLGCADGIIWPFMEGKVGRIVGVNYDDWLTKQCRQRFPDGVVLRADARRMPFESDSFDLIICLEMFHYLPFADRETGIREMLRVLRPGGRLVLTDPIEVGLPGLLKFIGRKVMGNRVRSTQMSSNMLWRRVFYKFVDIREQDRVQDFHFDVYNLRRQIHAVFGNSRFKRLPLIYPLVTTGMIVADKL